MIITLIGFFAPYGCVLPIHWEKNGNSTAGRAVEKG